MTKDGLVKIISPRSFRRAFGVAYLPGLKWRAPTYIAKVSEEVGYGLFACRRLRPGKIIGEYTGHLSRDWFAVIKKPSDMNPYLLKFPFKSTYAIDARKGGNETRFINHSSRHKNVRRACILHEGMPRVIFIKVGV